MALRQALTAFFLFASVACDGGNSSPTPTTASIPAIQISGSVTTYHFDLTSSGSQFGNISYIVTNQSNREASGCWVRVNWLDRSGLQVGFSYAATDASIPAGTSTVTNQDFVNKARIVNSRVEYSNCW
jgi:hypothetical protein